MRHFLSLFILLIASSETISADYGIIAEYSFGIGIPIPDIEDKAYTSLHTGNEMKSESQCLNELNGETVAKFALGQAMQAGATDVVLKCTKYWQSSNCGVIYPGCINKADVGNAKHLHLYNPKSAVPEYLRLSKNEYQVLQSISYAADENKDGNLDIVFVAQVKYDRNSFYRLLGKILTCEQAIATKELERMFRETYFSDSRTKAYKFNCYSVNHGGSAKLVGEKVITNNDS